MSEYGIIRIGKWKRLASLSDFRKFLVTKVPADIESPNFELVNVGYIEPGHGLKGKKQWLNTDDDVKVMYEKHQGKTGILLWAYSCVKKSDKAKKSSKRVDGTFDEHKKSLSEVDEKYDELRQKHGSKYTLEQLRMWAQMIRLGKHESTDEPPDKPFWRGCKRQQDTTSSSMVDAPLDKRASVSSSVSISPSEKVSVRSELIDQLAKWHKLNEAGVVSDTEYEDLKKFV